MMIDKVRALFFEVEKSAGLSHRLIPTSVPSPKINVEIPEVDWKKIRENLPYHRQTLDQIERFSQECEKSLNATQISWSKNVAKAFQEKIDDIEKEITYCTAPFKKIEQTLNEQLDIAKEKQAFLLDEKVTTFLSENPEWITIIKEETEILKYDYPLDSTPLEEE
eukprot:TRINITY_DN573_c0_g1_i1.p1 TRINITY_DN573_c0_g1~~TRINITY_DN573_c0_g1_i1.p1  ORF type:complete len:165 (-),score=34.28 TRINITY_DN573_c0_g1_i1:117-611(-)